MRVGIRVDAAIDIGSGHVMRTLTLAERLRRRGADVHFVCRDHEGHLCDYIHRLGFHVHRLPAPEQTQGQKANGFGYETWLGELWSNDVIQTEEVLSGTGDVLDWLVIDHYGIDSRWEKKARSFTRRILVIDDLANRTHDCDVLLDQNLFDEKAERYTKLVPNTCKMLLGPGFALLRDEFLASKSLIRERSGDVCRILIFFGGSDPTCETEKALQAFRRLDIPSIELDIVVGSSNARLKEIESLCNEMPHTRFHCQINYMSELMAKADFSIGAGGSTTWERCYMGLPSLVITTADNQVEVAEAVSREGAIFYAGHYDAISVQDIGDLIATLLRQSAMLTRISRRALRIMETPPSDGIEDVMYTLSG